MNRSQIGQESRSRPISRVLYPASRWKQDGDHLSSPPTASPQPETAPDQTGRYNVAIGVKQPTRGRAGPRSPPIRPCSRWGLTVAASPQATGRSYRPISPLPPISLPRNSPHVITKRTRWRYVSVPLSVLCIAAKSWALPSTPSGGARTFLPPD